MANTYTNLLYHIVFSTKFRKPLVTTSVRDDLYSYIDGIIRAEGGVLLEIGGVADHIHLAARLRAATALSAMVRVIKARSSAWINGRDLGFRFGWQTGYSAFTISESQLPELKAYIQRQPDHHREITFMEECVTLLELNNVPYEDAFL